MRWLCVVGVVSAARIAKNCSTPIRGRGTGRACSKAECQALRRKESQRRWRDKNPNDGRARRLRDKISAVKESPEQADNLLRNQPTRPGYPWGEVGDETSPEVLVIMSDFGSYVFQLTRDEISSQAIEIKQEIPQLVLAVLKDETFIQAVENNWEFGRLAVPGDKEAMAIGRDPP